MANQPEVATWEAGIYQFEITDPIEGGIGGIDNLPLLQLANRTLFLYKDRWLTGDIKEVDCNLTYLNANFDGTGLGTNERLGWAICNGNNGTRNRKGRVSVGYDPGVSLYSSLGNIFGSADAVVVAHQHDITVYPDNFNASGAHTEQNFVDNDSLGPITPKFKTESTGVSGTNKNLQPSMVTLFIQKL